MLKLRSPIPALCRVPLVLTLLIVFSHSGALFADAAVELEQAWAGISRTLPERAKSKKLGPIDLLIQVDGEMSAGDRSIVCKAVLFDGFSKAARVKVTTAWKWPSKEQLDSADLIVMQCYRSGGPTSRTWSNERIAELEAYLSRGGGFVVIHPATYTVRDLSQKEGDREGVMCPVSTLPFCSHPLGVYSDDIKYEDKST